MFSKDKFWQLGRKEEWCVYWRIDMSFVWNRQVRKGIKYPLENCLHFHVVSLGMLLPRMVLSFLSFFFF